MFLQTLGDQFLSFFVSQFCESRIEYGLFQLRRDFQLGKYLFGNLLLTLLIRGGCILLKELLDFLMISF
jgi:hypothetical protein